MDDTIHDRNLVRNEDDIFCAIQFCSTSFTEQFGPEVFYAKIAPTLRNNDLRTWSLIPIFEASLQQYPHFRLAIATLILAYGQYNEIEHIKSDRITLEQSLQKVVAFFRKLNGEPPAILEPDFVGHSDRECFACLRIFQARKWNSYRKIFEVLGSNFDNLSIRNARLIMDTLAQNFEKM